MAQRDRTWTRATLGSAATEGDPITVWCNNPVCACWRQHGEQYRAVLTTADLAAYAEKYGKAVTFIEFRKRFRCRHCGSADISTIVDTSRTTPRDRWERVARSS
jgi:hypothetical protein